LGRAKDIIVKPIPSKDANRIIKSLHYSGKVVPNSQLHLGVFLDGKCGGALQFGPSINKRGTINVVKGTGWNEFIELNRMALADWLPRNGESRAISQSMKFIKKHYPHIKWVVSFADGTQCGDGTIYRASGFVLTDIRVNDALRYNPKTGEQMHVIQAHHKKISKEWRDNWVKLAGYQLRYIYFLHKEEINNLTVPIIPFDKIKEMGASMYKGKKTCPIGVTGNTSDSQSEDSGSNPTVGLNSKITNG
jgi:hypothetical protein